MDELKNSSKNKIQLKQPTRYARKPLSRANRQDSIIALEEILQCGICLEKLKDSRMLPCQHTFCLTCLQSHLNVNELLKNQKEGAKFIKCALCQHKVELEDGLTSIENLPRNLYIDSLQKLVEGEITPQTQKTTDFRCSKCQTISQEQKCCQHCVQIFCNVCWTQHITELEANLSILIKEINESKNRLDHKLEIFERRCDQLKEKISDATQQKIANIKIMEKEIKEHVFAFKNEKEIEYDAINNQIEQIKKNVNSDNLRSDSNKVTVFMNLHKQTSTLLKEINRFGEDRIIFDSDHFTLEQDSEGIYNHLEENENGVLAAAVVAASAAASGPNLLETNSAMAHYYKTRSSLPKLIWNKCPRPGHVGIPPWDKTMIYVTATDTHTVLILKRDTAKLEGRLTSPEMLCPIGIAFSMKRKEIYISDKWQHCIHVFSHTGEILRKICSKGNGDGRLRTPDGIVIGPSEESLYISDTGNDRIIVVDPKDGRHISTIGVTNYKTILNMPMGIALFEDKLIVADTGNYRIKIFNLKGDLIQQFGSLGRGKGQFRSADVVAVDPLGFILVGDGGNARVQVFTLDGSLIKILGGGDGFGWVSGICVSQDFDIIITDNKTRTLRIF